MTITFRQFVEWYWKKLQRNGSGWTIEEIMEDCGVAREYITMLNDFCVKYGSNMTDSELIKFFEGGFHIVHTPFYDIIQALPGPSDGTTLTLQTFIQDLKSLVTRYGG